MVKTFSKPLQELHGLNAHLPEERFPVIPELLKVILSSGPEGGKIFTLTPFYALVSASTHLVKLCVATL